MSSKEKVQADGQAGGAARAPDGVSDTPAKDGAGESGGGGYPNPQTGKTPKNDGFLGHGGQTEIDYSGPGGGKGNAATENE